MLTDFHWDEAKKFQNGRLKKTEILNSPNSQKKFHEFLLSDTLLKSKIYCSMKYLMIKSKFDEVFGFTSEKRSIKNKRFIVISIPLWPPIQCQCLRLHQFL